MSVSFRGSILKDESKGQAVMLDEATLRDIIQTQIMPQNNAVLAQMQSLLLNTNRPLFDYMYNQITKYTNEFDWILRGVHNSKNMMITCTVTKKIFKDQCGNSYTYYTLPQYADNCYEYALRDELDRRIGPIMPFKWNPCPGVEINITNSNFSFADNQAIMFRNPGAVCGQQIPYDIAYDAMGNSYVSKYHYENIGNLVCSDLNACRIWNFQTNLLEQCKDFAGRSDCTLICWIYGDDDYHFYRYEPQFGVWSHKPGMMYPRCLDAKGDIIVDPSSCCWCLEEQSESGPYRLYDKFGGYIVAQIPCFL